MKRNQAPSKVQRRYGSDVDVEALSGISRKTLRKDRFLGRQRFPWYRVGRRVLYDLSEVDQIIRAGRSGAAVKDGEPPNRTVALADANSAEIGHE